MNNHNNLQLHSSTQPNPVCINRYTVFGGFAFSTAGSNSSQSCSFPEFSQPASKIQGNVCIVIAGTRHAVEEFDLNSVVEKTVCTSWPVNEVDPSAGYHVHCINNGTAIALCGHGVLAAAHYWIASTKCERLNLLMGDTCISVEHNGPALDCSSSQEKNFLSARYTALKLLPAATPRWLDLLNLRQLIARTSVSALQDGYLILEFTAGTNLSTLPPFDKRVSQHTRRAVIYVASASQPGVGLGGEFFYPVLLRYFAPQYGNPEDAATGSAARAVAAHYYDRHPNLFIHQQSEENGWLFTVSNKDTVDVRGASHCQGSYP